MQAESTIVARQRAPRRPRIQRVCQQCGAPFLAFAYLVDAGFAKFCSQGCQLAARSDARPPLTCEQCQKTFFTSSNAKRFCSRECANAAVTLPLADRFWARVQKSPDSDGCWIWTGPRDRHGYGQMYVGSGRRMSASRFSWALHNGPLADDLDMRHLVCDNPPCVRPTHLAPGDHAQNMADRRAKRREARGMKHGSAKLTDDMVRQIRVWLAAGESQRSIAGRAGVTRSVISRIALGKAWSHVT